LLKPSIEPEFAKLAKEKAAAAEKAAEEAAKNKYQQIISSMGMPDLADNTKGYLDAMKKGAKLIDRGFLKSNSFDKFCYPYDYPMYNIVELQQMLRSAQQHYENMVDKNRTSRVLGIFGDTIESAGKKVDQAKSRLEKAWGELKKSLDEAKTKSQELEKEVSGNKTRIDAANKELSKLDQYDTSNASQVQKLKKEIKDLTEKNSDAQKKLDGYQTLKSTFKL
jgi:septal ring factor EnvC (AmiA/AmiB activator)